jgi:exopolysaccharide production protein ExoQ
VIWIFIVASRLPSQWLGYSVAPTGEAAALEQGNPLDRAVWFSLIILAIIILVTRSFRWGDFVARNFALIALLSFALLSVMWSDFPLVTFKKWFRDLGDYLVILIALSDPRPLAAVRTVFRRVAYLLIPVSILVIKYFIGVGREYDQWTGQVEYVGAATSKNMLGIICLISGIYFFWDTVVRWPDRKEASVRRILLVNYAFIGMTLWLLHLAHSATSSVCLAIGCLFIAAAHSKACQRHPGTLKFTAPASFLLYLILSMGFGLSGQLNQIVGRQANFTDRTQIWHVLLTARISPLLGAGYQSFWLGSRLAWFWAQMGGDKVAEAHNGYLGLYLDLGAIGLFLLCMFLIITFRTICRRLTPLTDLGSLGLALWIMLMFYNVTEAAFTGGLLWIMLMVCSLEVQAPSTSSAHCCAPQCARLGTAVLNSTQGYRLGQGERSSVQQARRFT